MKRTFLSLAVFVASFAAPSLFGEAVGGETEDGSVARSPDEYGECTWSGEAICVDESGCDYDGYSSQETDYWYDAHTGEYHDLTFSDGSAIEEMVSEETADSKAPERKDMAGKEVAEANDTILIEDAATGQARSEDVAYEPAFDEYSCEMYGCEGYAGNGCAWDENTEYVESDEGTSEEDSYREQKLAQPAEEASDSPSPEPVEEIAQAQITDDERQYDDFDCGYDECWYEYAYQEQVAAESLSGEDGELGSDEELQMWMDAEIEEMVAAAEQQDEQIASYAEGELGSDEELEMWIDAEIEEMIAATTRDEQIDSYAQGELGSDEELEYLIDAEFDRTIAASQPQKQKQNVVRREAILSLARTLDQVSATLQAISQHLTDVATSEVAELPAWTDEPVRR